jgi:hypothetical protein
MRSRFRRTAAVLAAVLIAGCKREKELQGLEKLYRDSMLSDLGGLMRSEEVFRMQNGRYTVGADSTTYFRSVGVTEPKITLADSGWYATVTHTQLPGITCSMAIRTKNPVDPSAPPGKAICR